MPKMHIDPKTGIMSCLTCGTVLEESQIVVDALVFDDNQNAAGTFIDQMNDRNIQKLLILWKKQQEN